MDQCESFNLDKEYNNFTRGGNVQTTSSTPTTTTQGIIASTQRGRCESDAIHPRLLNRHQTEAVNCMSCGQIFKSTSLDEIICHYENVVHKASFANCHYCGGKVHNYQYFNNIYKYHSCSRCKSGKEN